MNKDTVLKRQELYEKVWSTPLTKLAESFNLSNNGLRKICIKLDIPLPPAGFWVKLKFGKKVEKTPLSEPKPNTRLEYVIDPTIDKTRIIKPTNLPEIKVVEGLRNLHPILRNTLDHWNGDQSIDWNRTITVNVSKGIQKRAFQILNTVCMQLEKLGYRIEVDLSGRGRSLCAIEKNFSVCFDLRELTFMKKIEKSQSSYGNKVEFTFNGKLELRINEWGKEFKKTFTDGPKKSVEEYVPEFINNMGMVFQHKKEEQIKREARRIEQERLARLEAIERRKREDEQRKADLLQNMSSQLRIYNSVKELILQVRSKYESEIKTNDALKEWLTWAEQGNENRNPIKSLNFLDKF